MINRILFLLTSILFLSAAALGQGPLDQATYMNGCGGTDDTVLLNAAVSVGKPIVIPVGKVCATNTITISVPLYVNYTGRLRPITGQTVTLTSGFWAGGDTPWQAFDNALTYPNAPTQQGTVSFSGNRSMREISIAWWSLPLRPNGTRPTVCDNSPLADDTSAINAAFVAGSGFTVTTPASVICRVQSPQLYSNTVLRLGANSIFKIREKADKPSAALMMRDCEDCVVDGGVFDGSSGGAALKLSHAVLVYGGKRLKLLNGRSQNAKTDVGNFGDGIYLGIGADAPQDVIVDKWTSTDNERQAISIIGCLQCRFTNNYFLNTRIPHEGAGMDFEPNPLSRSVGGLVLTSGSRIVTWVRPRTNPQATPPFKAGDKDCQINIDNFSAFITEVTSPDAVKISIPSTLTKTDARGTIFNKDARQVNGLVINSNTVTSATAMFTSDDKYRQMQIGEVSALITEFVSPNSVKISTNPPLTATGVSGTIFNKGSRQVNDLVINSNTVISATPTFSPADVNRQLRIDNFSAIITGFSDFNSVTISVSPPLTVTGVSGTISTIEQRYEDLLVEGNTISGNAGPGILFSNKNGAPYKGIRFVDNSIRDNKRTGLVVSGNNTDGLVIANNSIEGNRGGCADDEQSSSGIGLIIVRVEHGASVVGNTIANNDCTGIFISASSHVTLADNKIYRNGHAGIRIRPETVIRANSTIHGNSIFNNGTTTTITSTATKDDYAHAAGIVVSVPDGTNVGWEITANDFGNDAIIFPRATQYDGIMFLHERTRGVIVGPNIYTGMLGLTVRTSPSDSTPTRADFTADVNRNRFCWNVDGIWQCAGQSATATTSLTPPSTGWKIPANTSREFTLTVLGAAVSDGCYASPSQTVQPGLSFSCYISSINTATVKLGNVTTSEVKVISQPWRVVVSKFN